jgi:AraC family transcriptional regulator, regulatory protein of adaptative response / methylphosphotriester-DNA alkyltransferase methyltransferase
MKSCCLIGLCLSKALLRIILFQGGMRMDKQTFEAVYQAIANHDTKYDGKYYTGVKTTGIFCRPSCRSRTPKRENIKLYTSKEAAAEAGFRACKRCRPDHPNPMGPDEDLAQRVLDFTEAHYTESLTLGEIASHLNISPFHMQRVFKRVKGFTPAEQLTRIRLSAAAKMLAHNKMTVEQIADQVGFRNPSHFSSVFKRAMGASPSDYRKNFINGDELK